ncbi:MAG: hypothetical protein HY825_04650 [Acidobacteria bacterium]|nr:hypothetical protein [Acidobacteriota bacterium]
MRFVPMILAALFLSSPIPGVGGVAGSSDGPPGQAKKGNVPPGLAKKGGVPPGLAARHTLPPGLAKKFGAHRPPKAYVAFDPTREDRAWLLIDARWVPVTRLDVSLRAEVRSSLLLPPVPPPVPLPPLPAGLRVVLFE